MRTQAAFLQQTNHPELARAVFRQMGMRWSEIIEHPSDFRDAGAGVSGFVYYDDTVKFAKRHLVKIMNALNELESDIGEPLNKPTDNETSYYNWLAWFALETVIDDVMRWCDE